MRTSTTPVTIADKLKTLFFEDRFISELCADFGEPRGVAIHLKKVASSPLLMSILKNDIKKYEEAADALDLEYLEYKEKRLSIDCNWE